MGAYPNQPPNHPEPCVDHAKVSAHVRANASSTHLFGLVALFFGPLLLFLGHQIAPDDSVAVVGHVANATTRTLAGSADKGGHVLHLEVLGGPRTLVELTGCNGTGAHANLGGERLGEHHGGNLPELLEEPGGVDDNHLVQKLRIPH